MRNMLIVLAWLGMSSSVMAEVTSAVSLSHVDVSATGGGALWHGSAKDASARPYYGFNASWTTPVAQDVGLGLQFDVTQSGLTNQGRGFDLESESDLDVSTIFFVPTVCSLASAFHVCGGIGQGTVNVNGEQERRDYGTWIYTSSAKFFWRQFSLMAVAKYVGQIEEVSAGQTRDLGFKSIGFGIGYVPGRLVGQGT